MEQTLTRIRNLKGPFPIIDFTETGLVCVLCGSCVALVADESKNKGGVLCAGWVSWGVEGW